MTHRVQKLLTTVSLLLCAAAACLCVRSFFAGFVTRTWSGGEAGVGRGEFAGSDDVPATL